MKPNETVSPIAGVINNDLCIACGACVHACAENAVVPSYSDDRAAVEVELLSDSTCLKCSSKICGDVCPSINPVDDENTTRLGLVNSVHIGFSKKFQNNGRSSSGGIVRTLCNQALANGLNVICLTEQKKAGSSFYEAGLLTDQEQLMGMPGSIYHSVGYFDAITHLQKSETKCVLVAIPCQMEGILKYIKNSQPELINKISLKIGIICGWMYSDYSLQRFSHLESIKQPLQDVGYRGEDKVGLLKIKNIDGEHKFSRVDFERIKDAFAYRSSFSTDFNRWRCRLCQNHINIQSDVSVGDAWLARTKTEKVSIIILRSPQGKEFFFSQGLADDIILEPGSFEDVIESQSRNLVYGINAKKLKSVSLKTGYPVLNYSFDDSSMPTSLSDYFDFYFERLRRSLARSKLFTGYSLLYFVSRPRQTLSILRVAFSSIWESK